MNVLLVSQCSKRALTQTRRILDQFAERRGERTWQTPITQAGLDTLRSLLRKTARKNTAVACHWIRGRDHSELLWIVGNARQFNAEGAVPTNTTVRNVLRAGDEDDWHTADEIRLLAQLAALLHDLGKASVAFQERLRGKRTERNLYRHEWVSLRLFLAFVGTGDDADWLGRLASEVIGPESEWTGGGRYLRDGVDAGLNSHPFRGLTARAPLAAALAWLIVTHHRLPVVPGIRPDGAGQTWLGRRASNFELGWLAEPLAEVAHDWNEIEQGATPVQARPYWQVTGNLPVLEPAWRARCRRVAKALIALRQRRPMHGLDDPYVMHLARLALMLADHHYSSLGLDEEGRPVQGRAPFVQRGRVVSANTTWDQRGRRVANQSLLEHLLGVGHTAGLIAGTMPHFERYLPRLANHRGLRKRSADRRFAWQDKAFDAAVSLRESAREQGAFIVDMASTGCGKTLANARILYALADPHAGLRLSYALGLRTLTLQTGRSYRRDLNLKEEELAVLVGGTASRALFAYYERQAEAGGSASTQALIEEDSHVLYEGHEADHPLLSRALANPDIRKLLSASVLVCTVDHLAPATESLRAGRQIAPMLRFMSSDLVLDELDDYDLDDLPALTRLMHWAGLLGSRVVLSSATLPPALVQGMFLAYQAGRAHHRRNRGRIRLAEDAPVEIPCLWVDEFAKPQVVRCTDATAFGAAHARFVEHRVSKLASAEPLRRVELLPLMIRARDKGAIYAEFAARVRDACLRLHAAHAAVDPISKRRVSFGLVRLANIDPIFHVARVLCTDDMPPDVHLHLCVYHARFPLVQRSAIEAMLDATFNRRAPDAVWQLPEIRAALDRPGAARNHLFVVLASPVCEVGRDWDADWAVVEPSSMRSLIQLAGRVQRHRRQSPDGPNVLVFETNLKALEQRDHHKPAFIRPGFETGLFGERFMLSQHRIGALLDDDEYRILTAIPRIQPRVQLNAHARWVDLEHARMRAAMLPEWFGPLRRLERDYAPACWQFPRAALTGVLPQQQPFREDPLRTTTLAWLVDEETDALQPCRVEESGSGSRGEKLYVPANELLHPLAITPGERVDRWGAFRLDSLLEAQAASLDMPLSLAAKKFSTVRVPALRDASQGWLWHPWLGVTQRR